jgi:hypothetical protein
VSADTELAPDHRPRLPVVVDPGAQQFEQFGEGGAAVDHVHEGDRPVATGQGVRNQIGGRQHAPGLGPLGDGQRTPPPPPPGPDARALERQR